VSDAREEALREEALRASLVAERAWLAWQAYKFPRSYGQSCEETYPGPCDCEPWARASAAHVMVPR
jgi:hypothetical protein